MGQGAGGRSRGEQEPLEPLGWGGETGMPRPVRNWGLPGFGKYAHNMSECQGVHWRIYRDNPYFILKTPQNFGGVSSGDSVTRPEQS